MDRHSRIYWYRPYLRDTLARIVRPNNMPAAARAAQRPLRAAANDGTVRLVRPHEYLRPAP